MSGPGIACASGVCHLEVMHGHPFRLVMEAALTAAYAQVSTSLAAEKRQRTWEADLVENSHKESVHDLDEEEAVHKHIKLLAQP
eukprot:2824589-Rhodomonas_salina.1